MPVFRRICCLLVALAFALGVASAPAQAGGMDCFAAAAGLRQPMPDDDCGHGRAKASVCAQVVCTGMAAVLPPGDAQTPALVAPAGFTVRPDRSRAGISGLPEPPPPKPSIRI